MPRILQNCCLCFPFGRKHRPRLVVLILGLDGAGKTSVLMRLKGDPYQATKTSWGFTTATIPFPVPLGGGKNAKRQKISATLYDIGGDKKIRSIWKNYYAEAHACLYVVDSSTQERLAEAAEALAEVYQDDRMKGKPLLILANKQDLPTALSKASLYEALKINQLVPPNSSITSNAKDAGESKPEDWWVGIYPCIANVTDPNISGIDFANEMHIIPFFGAILERMSILEPRCARDTDAQRREWDGEREEQKKRVEGYKGEEENQRGDERPENVVGTREMADEDGKRGDGISIQSLTGKSKSTTMLSGRKNSNKVFPTNSGSFPDKSSEKARARSYDVLNTKVHPESPSQSDAPPPSPFGTPVTVPDSHHSDQPVPSHRVKTPPQTPAALQSPAHQKLSKPTLPPLHTRPDSGGKPRVLAPLGSGPISQPLRTGPGLGTGKEIHVVEDKVIRGL